MPTLPRADEVKFGAVLLKDFATTASDAVALEEAGYDSVWVSEHLLFWIPILDGITALAAVAAVTKRVEIGTAVYILPLRHPLVTAKGAVTADVFSGGRVILGIGVGGEFAQEFDVMGVPVNERGSRANEAIEVMRKLWTGERITHHGKHFDLDEVQMLPGPVRPGGIPVWVAGRSEAAMRRAARLGDGFMPYLVDVRQYGEALRKVDAMRAEAGRAEGSVTPAVYVHIAMNHDHDTARAQAIRELNRLYDSDFERYVDRFAVHGTPQECADHLLRYIEAGARHIQLATLDDRDLPAYQAYAAEIVPLVRRALG
jgi:probable F420-dependent oxidoreductase